MGLLSDPESGKLRVCGLFIKYHLVIGYVVYLAGLGWMITLCYAPFNAGTYFSENALLPGLVEPTFREEQHARAALDRLKEASRECETTSASTASSWDGKRRGCDGYVEALASEFRSRGLEVHLQRFNYTNPLMEVTKHGVNLYAILRAPRHASTESIVFSTSYSSDPTADAKSLPTLSMMIALATRFRKSTYWAKDIVFLAADRGEIGTQAWLEGYHEVSCGKKGYLNVEPLTGHAGSIQAALNFEFPSLPLNYVDVQVEGLNGQLPNLDLVTMVHKLCSKEGIKHTHRKSAGHHNLASFQGFVTSARTLTSMMTKGLGLGLPSGNHGLFLRFAIPAVTLRGHTSRKAHTVAGYSELGRAIEGMARCLNNLLERFHQSFFFYLLPASHRYISIGLYFGPFAAMAVPLIVRALAIWLSLPSSGGPALPPPSAMENSAEDDVDPEHRVEEKPKRATAGAGDAIRPKDAERDIQRQEKSIFLNEGGENFDVDYSVVGVMRPVLVCHAYGLLLALSPSFLVDKGVQLGFRPSEAVLLGFMSYGISLISSPLMQRWMTESGRPVKKSRYMVVFVALMELALVLFTLALYNIATAFVLATVIVPLALAVAPRKRWKGVGRVVTMLLNPVVLMFIASALDVTFTYSGKSMSSGASSFYGTVFRNLETTVERILSSTYFYGHWLFYVSALSLLPCWILLWHSQFD